MANEAVKSIDKIVAQYEPGGQFQQAGLKLYKQQKARDVAAMAESAKQGGLKGTMTGAKQAYEEIIGAPFKLGLEQRRIGALADLLRMKGGALTAVAKRKLQKRVLEAQGKQRLAIAEQRGGERFRRQIEQYRTRLLNEQRAKTRQRRAGELHESRLETEEARRAKIKQAETTQTGTRLHTGDSSLFDILDKI